MYDTAFGGRPSINQAGKLAQPKTICSNSLKLRPHKERYSVCIGLQKIGGAEQGLAVRQALGRA